MNYLMLLSEMADDYSVTLETSGTGWQCYVGICGSTAANVHRATPEEAIRCAYLALYPIEKNTRDGKLSQNE